MWHIVSLNLFSEDREKDRNRPEDRHSSVDMCVCGLDVFSSVPCGAPLLRGGRLDSSDLSSLAVHGSILGASVTRTPF